MAGEDAAHGLDQHLRRRAFGQVTRRPGVQCLTHQRQFIVHAEKQHPQLRQALAQSSGGFQATDARQAEVHDHQVRHALLNPQQRLLARCRLAHFHRRQQRSQQAGVALADYRMVIDQQNTHETSKGMLKASAQPAPGWLMMRRSPPRLRARSRIEYSPTPGRWGCAAPRPLSRTSRRKRAP
ncbi:hypothetical protein D3C76_1145630 [compost metagenome]